MISENKIDIAEESTRTPWCGVTQHAKTESYDGHSETGPRPLADLKGATGASCSTNQRYGGQLPSHHQAMSDLVEAREAVKALLIVQDAEDATAQARYDQMPSSTPTERLYRSVELLTHDLDQARAAAFVYSKAAQAAQRAGDTSLALDFEEMCEHAEIDRAEAETGLAEAESRLRIFLKEFGTDLDRDGCAS